MTDLDRPSCQFLAAEGGGKYALGLAGTSMAGVIVKKFIWISTSLQVAKTECVNVHTPAIRIQLGVQTRRDRTTAKSHEE